MKSHLVFCIVISAVFTALNPVMAQNKTLESLKIKLKEVNVCDTVISVLRTTSEQQEQLAPGYSVFMRKTEETLDKNLNFLSNGSPLKLMLEYLSSLKGNIDPKVVELYEKENTIYDALRKKMSARNKAEKLLAEKKQAEKARKIATGELPSPREAINSASKEIDRNPEGALMKLNEIVEKSNFSSSDKFIYELSEYQFEEITELQAKCLAILNRERDILPIYINIQKKIKAGELKLNASADRLYLSKIILLKTELQDTVGLFNDYKSLMGYIITKKETPQVSGTYAAIVASKGQNNQNNQERSVDEWHAMALKAAEPFVKERYDKEEFERRRAVNPYWGKQIASGSLFNLNQNEIEKLLGKHIGKEGEMHEGNHYEVFVYSTTNGKYHVAYRNGIAFYIVIYPNLEVKQDFKKSELMSYGWKFDLLNECSKKSFGLSSTSGYISNISYIDIHVDGGDGSYNTCTPYHVIFYSSDQKTVQRIVVSSL